MIGTGTFLLCSSILCRRCLCRLRSVWAGLHRLRKHLFTLSRWQFLSRKASLRLVWLSKQHIMQQCQLICCTFNRNVSSKLAQTLYGEEPSKVLYCAHMAVLTQLTKQQHHKSKSNGWRRSCSLIKSFRWATNWTLWWNCCFPKVIINLESQFLTYLDFTIGYWDGFPSSATKYCICSVDFTLLILVNASLDFYI